MWAHDALRCQRGTEQDGSFTHYVPRPPKEPDLSAPAPPQRWINGPDKAHYVSVQQGRKRSTRLSHAPNMRRSHALVKFDMMFAGLVSSVLHCPTSWSCFCSTAENVKNKYNKTKQNKEQKHKTKERPAGSGAERATTFWRNKHLESHWTLCWSGSIYRWEESSEITFWPLGLKLGLIFAPVYQPDCSNNLMTLNVVSYLTSLSRMSGVGPLNETWVNLWISLGLNTETSGSTTQQSL